MVYHSSFNLVDDVVIVCGCPFLPIRSTGRSSSTSKDQAPGEADIVDEALVFFRANVLFMRFDIAGAADRLLVYLTLFINMALRRIEPCASEAEGVKVLINLGLETFLIPGDDAFPLTSLFDSPRTPNEAERLRAYLRQVREEASNRLLQLAYNSDGSPNKWWIAFAKRKFLNAMLPL